MATGSSRMSCPSADAGMNKGKFIIAGRLIDHGDSQLASRQASRRLLIRSLVE